MFARLSLKVKLTALVVFLVTAASVTFGQFAVKNVLGVLQKAAGLGAMAAAQVLTADVDPTWLMSVSLESPNPEVQRFQERFSNLLGDGYVRRVELIRFIDKRKVEHVVSAPQDSSGDYYAPGTVEETRPGDLYTETTPGYSGARLETPGAFMAGWMPIMSQGKAVGLLFVFVDGTEVGNKVNTMAFAIIAALFVFILLSGIVAYMLSVGFEKTAVTDGLMGIYNHKFFKQRLEQEVAKSRRYGQLTSLVLLDIDFFKRVNDTYGHATGDITLKALAKWVMDSVRSTDIVARYGGEEIVAILPFTGIAGAQEFAERLRLKISNQVVKDPGEKAEFRITVSIGVAQWEKGVDMIELIKRADAALYHSKNNGRNQVTLYQEDLLPAPHPQTSTAVRH